MVGFNILKKLLDIYKRKSLSCIDYLRWRGVKIGENCNIHSYDFGSEPYLIELGDHVQITRDVLFFTHGGGWVLREEYPDFDTFGKIKIGNNVYIGSRSIILPGVTIGNNVVIGAGSIVTKSIPNDTIAAGNPARVIGDFHSYKKKLLDHNFNCKKSCDKKAVILSPKNSRLFIKK